MALRFDALSTNDWGFVGGNFSNVGFFTFGSPLTDFDSKTTMLGELVDVIRNWGFR